MICRSVLLALIYVVSGQYTEVAVPPPGQRDVAAAPPAGFGGTSAPGQCGLQTAPADAIDELLDSAVFIWAAAKRCGSPGEEVKCEIDVASAIQSMNAMANVILKALQTCGVLKAASGHECGLAVAKLTQGLSGLAAASGGLAEHCTFANNKSKPAHQSKDAHSSKHDGSSKSSHQDHRRLNAAANIQDAAVDGNKTLSPVEIGNCVVDMKDSFASLFHVVRSTMGIKHTCNGQGGEQCIDNALQVVAATSSLGQYLSGTVGHCSVNQMLGADCASEVLAAVRHLDVIAAAGKKMASVCQMSGSQAQALFLEENPIAPNINFKYVAFALMGILPISSALSFFAGSRGGKGRLQPVVRELESLVQVDDGLDDVEVQ